MTIATLTASTPKLTDFSISSTSVQIMLAIVSGILLPTPFINPDYFWASWIGFIPILIAINNASLIRTYCLALVFGCTCYMVAAYWIVDFLTLFKAYNSAKSFAWALVFWIYSAHLLALALLFFQVLRRKSQLHEFILFPLIIICFFAYFPMLFSVQLGEGQTQFLASLQAIEFTGVYALDGIIALANIMLTHAFLSTYKTIPWGISFLIFVLWFGYGIYALNHWNSTLPNWETITVGLVQPNEKPSLEKPKIYPGYSKAYSPEMEMTERLAAAGASLIVWPEARYKAYFDEPHVAAAYRSNNAAAQSTLIFQDMEQIRSPIDTSVVKRYNAVAIIDSEGNQAGHYRKQKRVAFGEYVPLISDVPILRGWVEGFFGKFLNEIGKGSTQSSFIADGINIVPLVCYEAMFPKFVGTAVPDQGQGNLLVAMSSNGWFGKTKQPYQHVLAAVLRAVENRTPMLHAVNNGPSTAVSPTGEILLMSDFHQAGGYTVDIPFSRQHNVSFFSRHPALFINSILAILLAITLLNLVPRR